MRGHAVFDLDGTLVDSAPVCALLLNEILRERGAPFRLTDAETRPFVTRGGLAMAEALLGAYRGDPEQTLAEFRHRYALADTPASSLYPGAAEALRVLHAQGIVLAICSNKPTSLCEKVLKDLSLRDFFSAVVGAGPDVPLKPDPTGYERTLALSGGRPELSCYVGDSEVDLELARAIGAPLVVLTHGYGDYSRPWPGAVLAPDFPAAAREIVGLLARLGANGDGAVAA